MDDMLQKYLKDKYGENYDKKAQEDYDSARSQNRWAQLGSDIGDAIGGQKVGSGDQYFQGLNKQAKENTIGKIANDKAQYVKDQSDAFNMQDIADKAKVRDMENDPMNAQAGAVRAQLSKLGVEVPEGMSLADMKRNFGDAKSLNEIKMRAQVEFENQKQIHKMEQGFKEKENALNRGNDLEKIQLKNELERAKGEVGAKLPSSEAGNLAKSSDALKDVMAFRDSALATTDYSKAGKLNPMRIIPGTEDYTKTRAYENQAKAMMQKIGTYLEGGKLTDVDFESKYLPMAPSIDDPPSLKKAKMDNLEKMVKQRLNAELDAYGKAGYNVKNFSLEGNVPGNPVTGSKSIPKTVRVTNGSETLEIPIEDLQHAKADGYNLVSGMAGK